MDAVAEHIQPPASHFSPVVCAKYLLSLMKTDSSLEGALAIRPNRKLVAATLEVFGYCTFELKVEALYKHGNSEVHLGPCKTC